MPTARKVSQILPPWLNDRRLRKRSRYDKEGDQAHIENGQDDEFH